MHVDINISWRHIETKKADRKATDHQEPAIGFAQSMLQSSIANATSIEKEILHAIVASGDTRICDVASQVYVAIMTIDRNQSIANFVSEENPDPLRPTFAARKIVDRSIAVLQHHMHLRKCNGDASKLLGDMPHLRLRALHELSTNGRVKEKMPDFDGCSDRSSAWHGPFDRPSANHDFRSAFAFLRSTTDQKVADFRDRGQSFAAKTERVHIEQVVGRHQFARRVRSDGQRELFRFDSTSII